MKTDTSCTESDSELEMKTPKQNKPKKKSQTSIKMERTKSPKTKENLTIKQDKESIIFDEPNLSPSCCRKSSLRFTSDCNKETTSKQFSPSFNLRSNQKSTPKPSKPCINCETADYNNDFNQPLFSSTILKNTQTQTKTETKAEVHQDPDIIETDEIFYSC